MCWDHCYKIHEFNCIRLGRVYDSSYKGDYELYKKINTKGNIITAEGIPRDAQINYSNKKEAKRFGELSERVDREVKVTVAK